MAEMWEIALAGAAVAVSVASAVVATLARRDSRRAAKAAEETVALERERRHDELSPTWTASVSVRDLGGSSRLRLLLRLNGPAGLGVLDEVVVSVRDNETHTSVLAGGPTQQDLDGVVWGPYRLVPGTDGADPLGRTAGVFALRVGEERLLELQPSLRPGWMADERTWAGQYEEAPVRLDVEGRRVGFAPWTAIVTVDQPQPRFQPRLTRGSDGTRQLTFDNIGTGPACQPAITTDRPGHQPAVLGTYREVIEPSQSTQTVVIPNSYDHIYEWVELAWTDLRGATSTLRAGLPPS